MTSTYNRRLMLVHAHPDDESSQTGATMARYASDGDLVTLVTCTLGEEGQIIRDDLQHLATDDGEMLAAERLRELEAAMAELGVTDLVRLGGDGRYRDSGMSEDETGLARPGDVVHENALWRADLLEAANELVPLIRDRRPQVMVTYDQNGNYGHPDHVMAHRIAHYATGLAAVPTYRPDLGTPWTVARLLWCTMNADDLRFGLRMLREAGDNETFAGLDPDGPVPIGTDPADLAAIVPVGVWAEKKAAALTHYATQVDMSDPFWSLLLQVQARPGSGEAFLFAGGVPFPEDERPAADLFAGLDV